MGARITCTRERVARGLPILLVLALAGCGSSGGSGTQTTASTMALHPVDEPAETAAQPATTAQPATVSEAATRVGVASAATRIATVCLAQPLSVTQVANDVETIVAAAAAGDGERFAIAPGSSPTITPGKLLALMSRSLRACARSGVPEQGALRREAAVVDAARAGMTNVSPAQEEASRNVAERLATQYGKAYNVYRAGGMSTAATTHLTLVHMMSRAKRLQAPGSLQLYAEGESWMHQMVIEHPYLQRDFDRWHKGMTDTLDEKGVTVVTLSGRVLPVTAAKFRTIAVAMQDPLEKAAEYNQGAFTPLQNRAKAVLIGFGWPPAGASAIVARMEKGGAGPPTSQMQAPS